MQPCLNKQMFNHLLLHNVCDCNISLKCFGSLIADLSGLFTSVWFSTDVVRRVHLFSGHARSRRLHCHEGSRGKGHRHGGAGGCRG
jgi:hypothetical protein